ncbi:MAG: MraY family glycosyltransferase [Planctomycetota bacterium]
MQSTSWIGGLLLATSAPAFLITLMALYPIRRYARSLGLLDRPGGHKSHTDPTPLGGGLGIFLGIALTLGIGAAVVAIINQSPEMVERLPEVLADRWSGYVAGAAMRMGQLGCLMAAATLLVVLGLLDDRFGIPWPLRLGVQFATAGFVVSYLDIRLTAFIGAAWLTAFLSVVWIVALINSFNMLDNMDGLSGGVAAIIAASMAAVMLTTPDPSTAKPQVLVAALLLVVCGALLGFLWHNRPPARIFMGDGGSYLVGFLIAVAMLMATYAGASDGTPGNPRPHAILAPLCAMAVPLYDMTTVLWIRIREGRSPFQGDRSHFSHRLVELGLSRTQAVLTIHLVTATCGLAAILLTHVTVLQAVTVLGIVACMLLLVVILESTGWRKSDE